MSEPTINEPKPCKKLLGWSVQRIRHRRKVVAELRSRKGMRLKVLVLKRRTDQEWRSCDSWAIEVGVMALAKCNGCTHVQLVVEDGRRYLIQADLVGPRGKEQGVQLHIRASSIPSIPAERFWLVPQRLFAVHHPPTDERDDALIERMKV